MSHAYPEISSYPVLHFTVSLIIGILAADHFPVGQPIILGACIAAVAFFAVCCVTFRLSLFRHRLLFGTAACLTFTATGVALHSAAAYKTACTWEKGGATYLATVTGRPVAGERTTRTEVRLDAVMDTASGQWLKVGKKVIVYLMADSSQTAPSYGDRLCMNAEFSRPTSEAAVTSFDYGKYLLRKGISGTGISYSGKWKKLDCSPELTLKQRSLKLRDMLTGTYQDWGLEGDTLAIVAALTIGDKSLLDDSLQSAYSAAGASHILALSGLHVGIIIVLLMTLFHPVTRWYYGRLWFSVAIIPVMWGFAFVSGLSPSVVRAVTMYSVMAFAATFSQTWRKTLHSLALTAMLMLFCNPMYVYDVGFQLSFVATAAISLSMRLGQPLLDMHHFRGSIVVRKCKAVLSRVGAFCFISAAAQLATMPLVLHYFGILPSYSLLTSLVITPLATLLLWSAAFAFAFSWFPFMCGIGTSLLKFSAGLMNSVVSLIGSLAGAQFVSVYISWLQAAVLAIVLVLFYRLLTQRSPRRLAALLASLCLLTATGIYETLSSRKEGVFFHRSALYAKAGRTVRQLTPKGGIYVVDGMNVCLASDDTLRGKKTSSPLNIDYLCISRGFRGSIEQMQQLFTIRTVVLDSSLPSWQAEALKGECDEAGIPYVDMAESGPHQLQM